MLKRIFSYMKQYKKYAFLALFCIAVEAVLELMVPMIMADLIDTGVATGDERYIYQKGFQMVLCAAAALVLGIGSARFAALAGQGLGANLREAEYEKLQSYSFANIDHFRVSSIVTRLTSDVTNIQNAVSTGMRPFGRSPVMLIFATGVAFSINSTLALVFFVALPVLAVLLISIIVNVRPLYSKMQFAIDRMNRTIQENLTAVRVVKAYVRGDYEIAKFEEANLNLKKESEKAFGIAVLNMPAMQFVMYATILSLLLFGGYLIHEGRLGIGELTGFLSYFPKEDTLFVLDEPNRLNERMELILYEYTESMKNRLEGGYILPGQTDMIHGIESIYVGLEKKRTLLLSALDYKPEKFAVAEYVRIDTRSISPYHNSFEYLADDLKKYKRSGYKSILVCNSRTRAARIVQDLADLGLTAYFSEDFENEMLEGTIMVTYGSLHKGFEYPLLQFVVIAENDIFASRHKKREKKKKYDGKSIAGFNELNIGDFVVHESHGLGVYKGIEKITVEGVEKDYIKIEYAGNSNLYVLATQLDRLQKYAAADTEKKPKLNKLGTQEWNKTKSKVHGAVEEVAKDLVALYAARQKEKGYQFGPDTVWQREFEEMFPYEETQDQLTAIEDTKRDMESTRIMDRLICGDVGYGKTEVAIRAAFKAVQEGKQVAYLVPTTILAQQIYNTFEQRMKNFPVTVAQLSSFRTSKEIKESISELKKGFVDIVIGTHRLLSKDVEFKDLGLLIIDEEQRFGVTHKEKIKKLKNDVDVMTLSATPIPRTLHMSLVGIRDMSVLEEPPTDRVPIQTFVTEHNDEMIREAIHRELARNGQVYYVYNRVRSIDEVAAHIEELVPEANVAYAHGQMEKRMLEKIMYEFINGEIDVLISTTIIETGVDISNVNTMIIEDADKFGLSQLYQLRGRVGRSSRTSYAFLLYRRDRMLTEVAEKRLSAIREFSDFGSGFKIAMKDLEIRGAGNVLGRSQHGHMAAVGYDLYCKMLNQAVNDLKGIKNEYGFETNVDLNVDAFIPSSYIKSEYQKLDVYKRIAGIESEEELSDMCDELGDRYGSLPASAANLLNIALVKSMAHKIGITEIQGGTDETPGASQWRTVMKIYPKADIQGDKIENFVAGYGGAVRFISSPEPKFVWRVTKKKFSNAQEYLAGLKALVKDMQQLT